MKVEDLRLDVKNPRHPEADHQRDAIIALLNDGSEKISNLAKDITEHGLSPAELLIVMRSGQGKYVVLEGNRRIAALKLLHHPDLVRGHIFESQFDWIRETTENRNIITEVPCAIVSSREEAHHWLELRHTGERGGAGIVPWSPAAQQRFSPRRGTQIDKAMKAIDMLRLSYPSDTELLEDLDIIVDNRLSTLGRLIGDPDVRYSLGIAFKRGEIVFSEEMSLPIVQKVISDLARNLSVSELKSKDQRRQYVGGIRDSISNVRDDTSDNDALLPTQPVSPKIKSKTRRKRATTQVVLFDGLELDNLGEKVSDILEELQRLDIERFPYAASVLLRSVIELSVDQFHKNRDWVQKDFRKDIRRCLDEIDESKKAHEYEYMRKSLSGQNSLLTPNTLHGYVHSSYFHPSPADLRAITKNYRPFLEALDAQV